MTVLGLQSWRHGGENGRYWVVKERGGMRKRKRGIVRKETGVGKETGREDDNWVVV